ncbi:MAG: fasciclin domain-containing protein [Acidobacteria bacterium]|nr:fasciclin domain-containing protein [Acidobacteriota bacterium]
MRRLAIFAVAVVFLFTSISIATAKGPQNAKMGPKGPSVVDVAIAVNSEGPFAGAFDTLIAAVLAADPAVLEFLTGNGQRTVFAPTDDAFADLGLDETNVGDLDQEFLTDVLLYHVARGRRYAEDVVASERIRMLDFGFLFQDGGVLTDNLGREANIIVTDVEAANGIIHAIDAVVLPYLP